ncbi:hypothetical protein VCR3J2_250101 [Vibrio coralliirubri]|nr:hypothetical protein VCR3J2_250101 [Vibrio coralliirubri]
MAIINDSLFFIYALGYQLYLDYCLSTTTRTLTSDLLLDQKQIPDTSFYSVLE